MQQGFLIAAPHSGSGKTTLTLGIVRALTRRGYRVQTAKAGPDFIDPQFHALAGGSSCINLDPWAMRPGLIHGLAFNESGDGPLVVEAMMGLFDGAAGGTGSAADLATMLGLPIVLVVDAAKQSHSIAALVQGFAGFRDGIDVAGIILNRVGSERHEAMLREALAPLGIPVMGAVMRSDNLVLPSRHLGLVQAGEHDSIEDFLSRAASIVEDSLDLAGLLELTCGIMEPADIAGPLPPPGQRVAIASDVAFAFAYPHLLDGWRRLGVSLSFFSPLADEAPDEDCDSVFLPGGYPELYGAQLAGNERFLSGLAGAAGKGAFVYGECGGYMVLGDALVDAEGIRHEMAHLLPLVTSFETRKLQLGYRVARARSDMPFATRETVLTAHEFHYSTIVQQESEPALFDIEDARGENLGACGLQIGNVAGSYLHLIDRR